MWFPCRNSSGASLSHCATGKKGHGQLTSCLGSRCDSGDWAIADAFLALLRSCACNLGLQHHRRCRCRGRGGRRRRGWTGLQGRQNTRRGCHEERQQLTLIEDDNGIAHMSHAGRLCRDEMIAAAQRRRQRHRIIQGTTDQQRPRQALGEAEGESCILRLGGVDTFSVRGAVENPHIVLSSRHQESFLVDGG